MALEKGFAGLPRVEEAEEGVSSSFLPLEVARPGLRTQLGRAVAVAGLLLTDFVALEASFLGAFLLRFAVFPHFFPRLPSPPTAHFWVSLWWAPLVVLLCLAWEGLYTIRRSFWMECAVIFKALSLGFLVVLAVVSLAKMGGSVSRTLLVLTWLLALAVVPAFRYFGKRFLARSGAWRQRLLILGAGRTGELVAQGILRDPYLGCEVVGFLDDDPAKKGGVVVSGKRFPVLGGFGDAERVMREEGVWHLVVAAPGMEGKELTKLANRLQRVAASVTVVPDLFGVPVLGTEADCLFEEQLLAFRLRNNLASVWNVAAKRAFDLAVTLALLPFALPLMGLIALAIKLDSPGPVIFTHRRLGRGGREFNCYKFRTMYVNNEEILQRYLASNPAAREEWERYAKLKTYDPRVTRVGRLLRKFSLDELPQIFNVLKGEMSLAGPRPYLPREWPYLEGYAETILLTYPGITGLWQVSGRNELDFEGRLRLESWYVRNWSLWLDLVILVRTLGAVLARRGAY